jgi:hypothetical protein
MRNSLTGTFNRTLLDYSSKFPYSKSVNFSVYFQVILEVREFLSLFSCLRLCWKIYPKGKSGCVIPLDTLVNCVVDQIFHVCGLKDLQTLCVCDEDPTGTKVLPTDIPEETLWERLTLFSKLFVCQCRTLHDRHHTLFYFFLFINICTPCLWQRDKHL